MRRERLAYVDVRPAVQDAFYEELQGRLGRSVWASGCTSWYQAPDGTIVLWPGFTVEYWLRTRRFDPSVYEERAGARARPAAGIATPAPRDDEPARRRRFGLLSR